MDILKEAEGILKARQPEVQAPTNRIRIDGSMEPMFEICPVDGEYCLMHKRCDICRKRRV